MRAPHEPGPERSPPPGEDGREGHGAVLVERVRLLESNALSMFAGTCTCVAGVAVLLRGGPDRTWLWVWAGLLLGLSGWRLWTVLAVRSRALDAREARARLRVAILHAWLSGGLWGGFGLVALPAVDPLASLVAAMVLTGLVGGATAVVSHLPSVYLPYTFLVVAPAAARLLLEDEASALRGAGVLLVLFLLFCWSAARTTARSVMQSIELRLRNADLVRDLTDAQGLAADLQRRTAEALERERTANRAKSRFVAAASHDLSQPLQSLRLQAGALRLRAEGGPLAPTAARIGESVTVLSELFGAILDLSQLESGTLEADPRPVALDALLTRLGDEFAPIARERGLNLDVGRTDATVLTDPVLLERVLRNLLANALRHTERGGVRLDVGESRGGRVRLRVIDTGPGIPPHQRERVFEEFVQLDGSARDRGEGIGLGLAIVRRAARLLDVELSLDEAPGGGTAVDLVLPVTDAVPDGAPVPVAPPRPPATDALTLLVIDDEADVRGAMVLYLESCGHAVLAVGSGDEALEALESSGLVPDGVVCDHRLRGGERGTDAIARVRARCGAPVRAVLVTGDADAADRRDIRDSGLPVLVKPCDPADLLALLRGPGPDPDDG